MSKLVILFVLFSLVALSLAGLPDDDDHYRRYDDSKKVVYVEKGYRRPNYQDSRNEPEYKKVVYKYEKPEEKKVYVNVKVTKPEERSDVYYKYKSGL